MSMRTKFQVLCDGLLATSCFWALSQLHRNSSTSQVDYDAFVKGSLLNTMPFAKVWFSLALLSSLLGICCSVGCGPSRSTREALQVISWLMCVFGLPCLCAQFYYRHDQRILAMLHHLAAIPSILAWIGNNESERDRLTRLVELGCVSSMAAYGVWYGNYGLTLAAVLLLIGFSTVNRADARLLLIPTVYWFKLALVVCNMLFVAELGVNVFPTEWPAFPFLSLF